MRDGAAVAALIALIGGFLLWVSAFLGLYALFSLGCVQGWTTPRVAGLPLWHGVLLAVWGVHLALHAGLIAWLHRRSGHSVGRAGTRRFLHLGALGVAVAALGATLWTGLPMVLLSSCG